MKKIVMVLVVLVALVLLAMASCERQTQGLVLDSERARVALEEYVERFGLGPEYSQAIEREIDDHFLVTVGEEDGSISILPVDKTEKEATLWVVPQHLPSPQIYVEEGQISLLIPVDQDHWLGYQVRLETVINADPGP